MATIAFLPVCSKCNSIIYDEVNWSSTEESITCGLTLMSNITPFKCPNCGEVFSRIAMPTKLPISTKMILPMED